MKRIEDRFFEPVEKVIREFEQKIGNEIEDINVHSHAGKRLRGELLVRLKDLCGLTFAEINKIVPFDSLKQGPLGKLYMEAKIRLKKMTKKSKKVMHRSNFLKSNRDSPVWDTLRRIIFYFRLSILGFFKIYSIKN